ncbi:ABC transporter ATP-binding protein [Bacillaceae bacterium SIJ1]|uniref:ABC transporter ATP-binding protein n=1 Tax=Litoribacterium kuwaitense TaxID=1398745 RepID=UPI0013EB6069|nr:ABC transporter ATP-binding protein [Litoribacterium kuwaitense]NGP44255.1 ABC transporter ATP-binding protein [Litoribacterium kuwaitense]
MAIFHLEDVHWKREGRPILQNINWSVEKGEKWVVFGKNGSGKTALLNIISGNMFPSSGHIDVFGETFGSYPLWEIRKRVGWVSTALQERLRKHDSVLNTVISGKFASIGIYEEIYEEDRAKAKEILRTLKMESFADHPYVTLSQGEKQRILLARALMADPELLILDEPCTGLDLPSREGLLQSIEDMARAREITIIYVTHHTEEVLPLFNKTLLLRNGMVMEKGATAELMTSEMLTKALDLPIEVEKINGRYYTMVENAAAFSNTYEGW